MVPARFGRTQAAPPPFLPKSPSGCPTLLERPQPVLPGGMLPGKEQGPGVIAVRHIEHVRHGHAGRGGTRGAAVFTRGEGKHAFAVIFLLCVGCSHAGRGKTGRLAEGRRFFWGKSARMSAERAASEVGRIREDGWEVSGKPRQRAAVCNCDSKEGCAGDSPEKARPGVCRRFPQPVLSQGRERRRFGRMNGVSPGGSAVP